MRALALTVIVLLALCCAACVDPVAPPEEPCPLTDSIRVENELGPEVIILHVGACYE